MVDAEPNLLVVYFASNWWNTGQLAQNMILGDVSGDGSINILDVVMIVQIVIGNDEIVQSADFNGDGYINILDVVQLIQIIIS